MVDNRHDGPPSAAATAQADFALETGPLLPPSPPVSRPAPSAATSSRLSSLPSAVGPGDDAKSADAPKPGTVLQVDVGTPGSQVLLETLFPSGSECGSPPSLQHRPTRSPSLELQSDDRVADELLHNREGLSRNGYQSVDSFTIHPTPSARPSFSGETISSVAGLSSLPNSLPPAALPRNASPGSSRLSPLPPATSRTSAAVVSEPALAPRLNLPVVSYRIVEPPPRPHVSAVAQTYGYNAPGPNGGPPLFVQPVHLMRSVDPIEADLMNQVEYDMDPQDYAWVAAVNEGYRKSPTDPMPNVLTDEFFTIALDRIEKEWWELTKRIPNPRSQMPSEEEACAICDDADGENSNAIVFCDGCNLAVHQDCYGVPYIPEGQWLCRKCTVSPENPVSCVMCPSEGGAFKQTTTGKWAHLLCAIWVPEAGVGNTVYMEPIDGVEMITKQRWKLKCSLCKKGGGACIQCENKSCYTAFHPTCAREAGLLGSMKTYGDTGGVLKAYCERHIPPALKATNDAKRALYHSNHAKKTKKSARAHAKGYEVPPPLLPHMILDSVIDYVKRMPGPSSRKKELVDRIGRYWSLKREARRGAPLLKRLHLEPWTAADLANQKTEEEKEMQATYLMRTRQDLEQVRMLNGMVLKREKAKQRQIETINELLRPFIKPWDERMYDIIDKLRESDKRKLFHDPVDLIDEPEYYNIIPRPMSFQTIEDKLGADRYTTCSQFETDVLLVSDNAMAFNPPGHPVHKAAAKIKEVAIPMLADLRAAVLENSWIDQEMRPHRLDWIEHHKVFEEPIPPFPEEEILIDLLGPNHEPIDNLEAHPETIALLNEPLPDGSGQTFLDSLFDYKYEVEPEPELEPVPDTSVAPAEVSANGKNKGKGKAREETHPPKSGSARIRLRVQDRAPSADTPVRQSSRKRPREASTTPPPSVESRRPSFVESVVSETIEDPAVAEKRRMFLNFEQPTILPEGSRRRAAPAFVPPRPNNQTLAASQQEQSRKKATQRREKEARVIVPDSFVPNVKVPKRRPKGEKKDKKGVPPPPAGPTPSWTFDDDESSLSDLSSHVSEVESESEPEHVVPEAEPLEELLLIEPRPPRPPRVQTVSSGDDDDEVQEVSPPPRRQSNKQRRPAASASASGPSTPATTPRARSGAVVGPSSGLHSTATMEEQAPALRKTRSSPVPAPASLSSLRGKPPAKQSSLRLQVEPDSDESDLSAVAGPEEGDDDDGSLASLFGSWVGDLDAVEGSTSDTRDIVKPQPLVPSGRRSSQVERRVVTPRLSTRSSRQEANLGSSPEVSSSTPRTRSNQQGPTPKTRGKAIVNVKIPTTARSRKGLPPGVSAEVAPSPAPAGPTRSSARRSSLIVAPSLPLPPQDSVENVKQPVASSSRTTARPRSSMSTSKGKERATSDLIDVDMEEPIKAAEVPTPYVDQVAQSASKRGMRRSSRAHGVASYPDPAAPSEHKGSSGLEPADEIQPAQVQESQQTDDQVAADIAEPALVDQVASPNADASPPPPAAPASEKEEEQDAPATSTPKKQFKKAAARRSSTGPIHFGSTRSRRSLPVSASAAEPELELDTEDTEAVLAPMEKLSRFAQRKAAAAAKDQASKSAGASVETSDTPIALARGVEPESEQEFDEKGRPKRRREPPKRFHQEEIVITGSPPPIKRQKIRRAPAADHATATYAEVPEPTTSKAEDKEAAQLPPSGVWDDEEEEDETYTHGTLVWCQAFGHPWYPAEIVVPCQIDHDDLDEEEVPADIHQAYKATRQAWADGGAAPVDRPFLVHFFDTKRFWGNAKPRQLTLLSEDQVHDRALLTHQPAKNFQKAKKDILEAYERAWNTLEPELPNPLPPWFEEVRTAHNEHKKKKKNKKGGIKAAAGAAAPPPLAVEQASKVASAASADAPLDKDVQMADASAADTEDAEVSMVVDESDAAPVVTEAVEAAPGLASSSSSAANVAVEVAGGRSRGTARVTRGRISAPVEREDDPME